MAKFCSDAYYIFPDPLVNKINELIKDTGYQYYAIDDEHVVYAVFSEDETEKLKRERGWKLSLPQQALLAKTHSWGFGPCSSRPTQYPLGCIPRHP
ncbi:MAG: hypothetical protein QXF52_07270 [Thermoproteota archaeon]